MHITIAHVLPSGPMKSTRIDATDLEQPVVRRREDGGSGEAPEKRVGGILDQGAQKIATEYKPWEIPIRTCCTVHAELYEGCLQRFWKSKKSCHRHLEDWASCRLNIGASAEGKNWMACYHIGELEKTVQDTAAMRCIIDQHYRQEHKCISIKNSPCEAGYEGVLTKGRYSRGDDPVSAQCSRTLQAAADSMAGIKTDKKAITLWTTNDQWTVSQDLIFDSDDGKAC
ncbi:MAG: hypothetical protein Q9163_000649 [Psora crenata]